MLRVTLRHLRVSYLMQQHLHAATEEKGKVMKTLCETLTRFLLFIWCAAPPQFVGAGFYAPTCATCLWLICFSRADCCFGQVDRILYNAYITMCTMLHIWFIHKWTTREGAPLRYAVSRVQYSAHMYLQIRALCVEIAECIHEIFNTKQQQARVTLANEKEQNI